MPIMTHSSHRSSTGRVGVVVSIARFPMKSTQAEPLEAAELHWPWLHGDRQYAFVKQADTSAFPWLTARDLPGLLQFEARYDKPEDPAHSKVSITDPEGAAYDIRDPALAARLSDMAGAPVALLRLGRGCFDAMAVSILTTTIASAVEQAHGSVVPRGQFRANLVIQPDDPAATEQAWLGQTLAVGTKGACLEVGWATPRCAMVGIDAMTGERDPTVVRTVARQFHNRVGAYCSVHRPGSIRVGDAVTLLRKASTGD